jgi:subtilisin-like proprotein convertase family protein
MTVVAQSSGNTLGITTTSNSGYTSGFGGTSSASPLGAGVVALVLEANPALSWRDVTGVLIESARINHASDPDWTQNGTGRDVSLDYGFGSIDATAAVTLAQSWTSLPVEQTEFSGVQTVNQTIPDNNPTGVLRTWNCAQDITLEAVEVIVDIQHTYIGDIEVELVAPSGTVSLLTKQRSDGTDNMNDYRLTSLRHWGESSQGTWTLRVSDRDPGTTGTWKNYEIKVFGHAPGAGPQRTLSSGTAVAGQPVTVDFTGGTPSANVWLAYSLTGTGSTFVPQLGLTLGIAQAAQLGSVQTADAAGSAAWTLTVPAGLAGSPYWLQALQAGGTTNVLSGTVQ